MPQIKYSERNAPHTTMGTVDPIKLTAKTTPTPSTTQRTDLTNQQPPAANPSPVAPEVTATPVAQGDEISGKFAALARKEKALRAKWQEIANQEAEFKAMKAEAEAFKKYKERIKAEPLHLLNEEGITYDQLVKTAVDLVNPDPTKTEVNSLKKELESLKQIISKQSEDNQTYQKTQREQAEKQVTSEVQSLISSNPSYETVKDFGYEEAVTQLIFKTYDEEGIRLDTATAAQQIEDFLKAEVDRINGIPSVKKRLQPVPETPAEGQAEKQQGQPAPDRQIKTLSHTASQSASPSRPRTWAERKAAAIAKATGKL